MKAYERLLKYVVVRTPSDENSETVPSSQCQFDLARLLKDEMESLGLTDVVLDDQCYLYGKLPATPGYEDKTSIGFIAHMDTVSDFCDQDIHPVITENYNGEDLPLGDSGLILSTETFPHLKDLKGRTLQSKIRDHRLQRTSWFLQGHHDQRLPGSYGDQPDAARS